MADSWYLQALALARELATDERHYWAAEQTGALAVLMELLEPEPEPELELEAAAEGEAEGQQGAGELLVGQGQFESPLPQLEQEQAHHPEAQTPFPQTQFESRRRLEEGHQVPLGLISCKFRVCMRRVVIPVTVA